MKYIDLHSDALTNEGTKAVTGETLLRGGCSLQCFAAFVRGRENAFARAMALCDDFDRLVKDEGFCAVTRPSELREGAINAMLTVEGGEAIEGDLKKLEALCARGVRMLTLLWNFPNELGYPNLRDYERLGKGGSFARREARGLTAFGREATARMREIGMMIDVSHASDGVFHDVAEESKRAGIPFLASHSGAAAVCNCARNLTDGQIRTLADCGGVIGLYFCADFLSHDCSAEGQRSALLAHAKHIINVGGENVLCFGSDFDGIPENAYVKNPIYVQNLLEEFQKEFGPAVTEKIARNNFLRFFRDIC